MFKFITTIILMWFLTSCAVFERHNKKKVFVLQPFQDFTTKDAIELKEKISSYNSQIIVSEKVNLPISAYYSPRNRYRADSILKFLSKKYKADTLVIGLTHHDISTTKNGIKDWGIMGLGYRPGDACVISTYRLKKQNLKNQLFKVVLHEIGHTQGLPHCENTSCLMRDAEGGNPLDQEKDFCIKCKEKLSRKGINTY